MSNEGFDFEADSAGLGFAAVPPEWTAPEPPPVAQAPMAGAAPAFEQSPALPQGYQVIPGMGPDTSGSSPARLPPGFAPQIEPWTAPPEGGPTFVQMPDAPPQAPPPPTDQPPPRPAMRGGGGYAPLRETRHYYPPGYEQHLAERYSEKSLSDRHDKRMEDAYRDRYSGKISEEQWAKAKQEADAAREAERAEGARELGAYREWQGTSMGMQHDLHRQGTAMEMRKAEAQRDALGHQQWASQMQAGAQQRMMREAEEARAERLRQEAEHNEAYEREMGKYQDSVNELSASKVDPGRYWKTGGPMRILMSVIGAGLLGAAGKPEVALNNIQQGIKSDMDAQRADIETRKAGVAAQGNILSRMREKYGDIGRAEEAATAFAYRKFANRVRLYSAKADTETKRTQMNFIADQMDAQAKFREDQLQLRAKVLAEQEMLHRARLRAGARAQQAKAAELQALGYELSGADMKRYVPGVGLALPGSDVKELRTNSADLVTKRRLIAKARGLLGKAAQGAVLSPTDKKLLLQVQSQLQAPEIKKIAGASMTDQEMEKILPGIGGDFTSYTERNWGDAQRVLGNYDRHLESQARDQYGAHVQGGKATQYVDDKGRLVTRFRPEPGAFSQGGTANIRPPGS